MQKTLFENVNSVTDPDWIIKEFFNSINTEDRFLWALPLMLERVGCAANYAYCFFPDMNAPDPEYHFEGVKIGLMDEEVLMTYDELLAFIRLACSKYVQLHPEHKLELDKLITQGG